MSMPKSPMMMTLMVVPVVLLFFFGGVYVGSQFMADDTSSGVGEGEGNGQRQGLPGTKNIVRRWSNGNVKQYLRGAAAEIADVARRAEALVGLSPPAKMTHTLHLGEGSVSSNSNGNGDQPPPNIDHALLPPVGADGAPPQKEQEEEILRGLQPPLLPNSVYNHPPLEKQHLTDFAAAGDDDTTFSPILSIHTLNLHYVSTPFQLTLSMNTLNPLSQSTLSTHYLYPPSHFTPHSITLIYPFLSHPFNPQW